MRLRPLLCVTGALLVCAAGLHAQTSFWNVTSGNWSSGGNWTPSNPANNGTADVGFSLILANTSTVDTAWSVNSASILVTSGTFSLLGSTTLTVGAGGFTDTSALGATIDPVLAGTMALNQNGLGTLTLNGANTYSGNTIVTSGILTDGGADKFSPNSLLEVGALGIADISNNEAVSDLSGVAGLGGSVVIGSGATLSITGVPTTIFPGVISGAGSLNMAGNVLDLTGENIYSGGTTVTSGTLEVDNNPLFGSGTGTGPIMIFPGATLQLGNGGVDTNGIVSPGSSITDNGTVTFARADVFTFPNTFLAGTGGIFMVGHGTLTLSGNNNYSGPTTVQFGTLVAGSSTAFGNGLSALDVVAGGTLVLNTFSNSFGSIAGDNTATINLGSAFLTTGAANAMTTFAGVMQGTGGLIVVGTGTTVLTGPNTLTGPVTIPGTGATLQVGDGATPGATIASASSVVDSGTLVLEPAGSDNILYQHGISGIGAVTVNGTGTIMLGGTNSYSGLTSVTQGVLTDAATNAFSSSSNLLVDTNGTVAARFSETVGNVQNGAGGGNISIASGATLTSLGMNYLADFQGVISGAGSFEVAGGVQGLSGNNTYMGGTLVSGNGEIFVGSNTALGTGVLTFNGTNTELSPDTNVTLANNIVLDSIMDNDDAGLNNLTLTGQISGPAGITWCTPGDLTLTNIGNNFSGGVDMREGTLFFAANNVAGTGTITLGSVSGLNVASGTTVNNPLNVTGTTVTLSGSGTIATPVTANSSIILAPSASPGGGPGNLTFSSGLTVTNGATINFNIYDANGTAGTGYSLITATGGLNLTASPNTVNLDVFTINSTGGAAQAINFNLANSYSWTFATSTSAITGFNVNQFNVNTAGFLNGTAAGFFSVSGTTNNLVLNFTPVPEPSTWALMAVGAAAILPFALRRKRTAGV